MDLSIMVENVKFNYRAGLMITKNNKVLVECNPVYDFVTIPGGRVKTLESSIDALNPSFVSPFFLYDAHLC